MGAVAVETVKKPPVSGRLEQGRATGWAWSEGRDMAQTWGKLAGGVSSGRLGGQKGNQWKTCIAENEKNGSEHRLLCCVRG